MPDVSLLFAFLAAASILTITPGVDTAMVLRAAATRPRTAAFASVGIALGCLVWAAAVSLGLGVLLQASEIAYTAVKWAGAAYLCWLGAQLLLKPRTALEADEGRAPPSDASILRRGFLTNILNPKVGVFYVTFLPQFIPVGADVAASSFLLASIHVVLTLIWFSVLIAATVPLGRALRRPAVVRTLDRLTGAVFIGFGLRLAASRA